MSFEKIPREILTLVAKKLDIENVSNLVLCSREISRKVCSSEYWNTKEKDDSNTKGLKGYIFRCRVKFNSYGGIHCTNYINMGFCFLESLDILKKIRFLYVTQLILSTNFLETFPDLTEFNFPCLEILYLNNNRLKNIPRLKLPKLLHLLLSSNLFTDYNTEDLVTPKLELLTLENNPVSIENKPIDLTRMPSLKEIRVSSSQKLLFSKMILQRVKIAYEN